MEEMNTATITPKKWHCRICGYEVSRRADLRKHHIIEHPKQRKEAMEETNGHTLLDAPVFDEDNFSPASFVLAFEQRVVEYRGIIEALERRVNEREQALSTEMEKSRKLVNELNSLRYQTKSWQDQLRATSAALSKPKD
jgi:hypothetical protein